MAVGLSSFRSSEYSHATDRRLPSPTPSDEIRRLDWRFLLPTPELKRVFFLGPPSSSLLRALWAYGCDVVTSPPAPLRGASDRIVGQYDVCVLQSPEQTDVELAARLVGPGGWLYWEITRGNPLMAAWRNVRATPHSKDLRSHSLTSARRLLERSGLRAITTSWHHPDFDSCRRIIPLEGSVGVRYVVRNGPAFLRPVGEWLGSGVIARAFLSGRGSAVSFVAHKPSSSVKEAS